MFFEFSWFTTYPVAPISTWHLCASKYDRNPVWGDRSIDAPEQFKRLHFTTLRPGTEALPTGICIDL